jgi:hypothetical protein
MTPPAPVPTLDALPGLCSNAPMHPQVLLLLVPSTLFWVLVFVAVGTGRAEVWFAAGVVGVLSLLGFLALAAKVTRSRRGGSSGAG